MPRIEYNEEEVEGLMQEIQQKLDTLSIQRSPLDGNFSAGYPQDTATTSASESGMSIVPPLPIL